MPFTFSHPAAILPLHYFSRKKLSITGLIAGSLVPDFEYFVRDFHKSFYSHTWAGLFYIDVPAGLLLCFLYHLLIRDPFYNNAPYFLKRKLASFQPLSWMACFQQNWKTVLLSLLLGAASHLVWDKLTHHTVPMVQSASGFNTFVTPKDRNMTYFLFWDINSLIGGFLVLCSVWWLPAKRVLPNKNTSPYWICFGTCTLAFFLAQVPAIKAPVLDNVVIALINGLLLSTLATSTVFTIRLQRKHQNQTGEKSAFLSV